MTMVNQPFFQSLQLRSKSPLFWVIQLLLMKVYLKSPLASRGPHLLISIVNSISVVSLIPIFPIFNIPYHILFLSSLGSSSNCLTFLFIQCFLFSPPTTEDRFTLLKSTFNYVSTLIPLLPPKMYKHLRLAVQGPVQFHSWHNFLNFLKCFP